MILDNLCNFEMYRCLGEHFATAVDYVREHDLKELPLGRTYIDGDNVFAIVSEKELTQVPQVWEAHRKYADIQLILEGHEVIGWYPRHLLEQPLEFPTEKDNAAVQGLTGMMAELSAGDFMIAFPQDIHLPNCPSEKGSHSQKVILKIRLD